MHDDVVFELEDSDNAHNALERVFDAHEIVISQMSNRTYNTLERQLALYARQA